MSDVSNKPSRKELLAKSITSAFSKCVSDRNPIEHIWRDAFDYSVPLRGQGFRTKDTTNGLMNAASAKKQQATIYDSTAGDSVDLLTASMISGLTPSNSLWFTLGVPDLPGREVAQDSKVWLETSANRLFKLIHAGNYDAEVFEFFTDISIAGMSGLYIEYSKEKGFTFENWPLASMYVAETLGEGYIDTVYRECSLTLAESANKFGLNSLSKEMQEAFKKNQFDTTKHPFIHAIRPRMKGNGKQSNGKLKTQLPFESVYVDKKSGMVVYESGFNEFPVVIPRWQRIPDTEYAVGPLNKVLPDVKTLNKIVELILQNGEMAIAGTFIAKDDGVLNPRTIKIGPRRVVFASDINNIKPLTSGGNFNIAYQEVIRLQGQIKKGMMSDQLAPTEKANISATEVQTRVELIRNLLGPIYGRLQAEFCYPLIRRCWGLAFRAGEFGQPPESMLVNGYEFVPTYQSPHARSQKLEQVVAIDRFENALAVAIKVDQEVLDIYDIDAAERKRADLLGVPSELIRSKEDVAAIRQNRQATLQAAAAAQAGQPQAPEVIQ